MPLPLCQLRFVYKYLYHCNYCKCVSGAPWSAANRQHGQRTGAFSWLPVIWPSQKDRPIPVQPCQEMFTWKAVRPSVISVSPRTRDKLRHLPTCNQPLGLCHTYIPPFTSIPTLVKPTIAMTDCTHALFVTNLSAFHTQL